MPSWRKLAASGASGLLIAGALAAHFEGQRLNAYRDAGGVWTICQGHTAGVKPGDVATPEICARLKAEDTRAADQGVSRCIHRPMTNAQRGAFIDFVFNEGEGRFCRSTIVRRFNAGDVKGACAALLWYTKADRKTLPGLVKRRREEYGLCMMGET